MMMMIVIALSDASCIMHHDRLCDAKTGNGTLINRKRSIPQVVYWRDHQKRMVDIFTAIYETLTETARDSTIHL
jgi:hypothetical protein